MVKANANVTVEEGVILNPLPSLPAGVEGQIVYDNTDDTVKVFNGSTFVPIGGAGSLYDDFQDGVINPALWVDAVTGTGSITEDAVSETIRGQTSSIGTADLDTVDLISTGVTSLSATGILEGDVVSGPSSGNASITLETDGAGGNLVLATAGPSGAASEGRGESYNFFIEGIQGNTITGFIVESGYQSFITRGYTNPARTVINHDITGATFVRIVWNANNPGNDSRSTFDIHQIIKNQILLT